jgi:beta-glucosidase
VQLGSQARPISMRTGNILHLPDGRPAPRRLTLALLKCSNVNMKHRALFAKSMSRAVTVLALIACSGLTAAAQNRSSTGAAATSINGASEAVPGPDANAGGTGPIPPPPSGPANIQTLESRLDGYISKMTTKEKIQQLYYQTDGNSRLGIPQFQGSDGPHGVGSGYKGSSCFPVTIALAATWEPALIRRVGRAISLEQAALKRHRIAGPALDLLHDPRNGRAAETIGEDPFLGGRITEAFVLGQNTTAVFGSAKHFNLNTYELKRTSNNYLVDQRTLVEFWGPHWRRTVQYGGAISIMAAYNKINGDKCAESHNLLKAILRDLWGFSFYTTSDWGGLTSAAKGMNATLDFCEGNRIYIDDLPNLVAKSTIPMAQLDYATKNLLRTKLIAGMLDGQPVVSRSVIDSAEHRKLVYEAGLHGIVLLKNSGNLLPLSKTVGSVAVIGPNANVLPLDGASSSEVKPSYTITPRQGIETIIGATKVQYTRGCDINSTNRADFAKAINLARSSDVVVFVGGLDRSLEGEEYASGGDRKTGTCDLPGQQSDLVNQLATANSNTIVVIISGGTVAVNKIIKNTKGIIYAFYPGQEGGKAIADVLFGNYNPSGKMPVTMPKNDAQLPARDMDFRSVVRKGVGYRWYDSQNIFPEFAFGAGLSYTTFQYTEITVNPRNAAMGQPITVTAKVTNTGPRDGEEVAQLYITAGAIVPNLPMPKKELKGFQKVMIKAGASTVVSFRLMPEEFYLFDAARGTYRVPTGAFTAMVGGSSADLPLRDDFTVSAAPAKPDLIVRNIRSMPAFPKAGDNVVFLASILNVGTGPSPENVVHRVAFYVNDTLVCWSDECKRSIPVGGMTLVCADGGPNNKNTWNAADGSFVISAFVDSSSTIAESIEDNNRHSATLTLPGGKVTN